MTISKIYIVLLIFVPLSILSFCAYGATVSSFVMACLGIVPLAKFMGEATESLSSHLGEVIGGLLNASFGNACELIIAISALRQGLFDVVKASITGSIISNVLLVLGASMFFGGMQRQSQKFNKVAAMTSATLLALAAISLIIPTVFHYIHNAASLNVRVVNESKLALAISVVLFMTYLASLFFTLKTHRNLYVGETNETTSEGVIPKKSISKAIIILTIATIFVTVLSQILVNSIEPFAHNLGLSQTFIGVILIAIIGNAAEHSTAIYFAAKNKIDLSINIALGSGSQIALFVAPFVVFTSFVIGKPMNLCFTYFEVLSIAVSVIILSFVTVDGECNWLEGFQLMAVYLILASAFYFL